ncbi:MAG: hypothetical protein NZ601_06575 [candidate division WOR-3 bacterium]|nr:hypothetical protein [candidate division WOR-3 bacterium]MCX7757291.1 hypothetical protein [candidate division WOR-3 bacterium]MDW7988029.1 hypothetical protein [candidate division WOR-3 bacterium]
MAKIIAIISIILINPISYGRCMTQPACPIECQMLEDIYAGDYLIEDREEDPRDIIEHVKIYRLTELLNLTEDQSVKFFPQLKELRRLREEFRLNQQKLLQRIKEFINRSGKSETDLKALIDEYEQLKKKFYEDEAKIHKEISKILSPEQYAKFLMFQAQFGEEIRRMIREASRRSREMRPRLRFW